MKNEDDVREVTDLIGEAASKLPVPYIGDLIKKIPDAIDFFAGLDTDDEVFRCAEDVTLDVLEGGVTRTKMIEPRTRESRMAGPITISDWNYSVEFAITWTGTYPDFEQGFITSTMRPHRDPTAADWVGLWRSADDEIGCRITRSKQDPTRLDITSEVADVVTTTTDAAISQVTVELLPYEPLSAHVDLIDRLREEPPVIAVTTPKGDGSVIERIDLRTDRIRLGNLKKKDGNVIERIDSPSDRFRLGDLQHKATRRPKTVASPVGGARVQLDDGRILEIHEVITGGKPSGYALHYIGPAKVTDVIFNRATTDVAMNLYRPLN